MPRAPIALLALLAQAVAESDPSCSAGQAGCPASSHKALPKDSVLLQVAAGWGPVHSIAATKTGSVACDKGPAQDALIAAPAQEFVGKVMYTDYSLRLCEDCVARCWQTLAGECAGFTFERYEGDAEGRGACTFFSTIEGAIGEKDYFTGVTTASHQHKLQPPTANPGPLSTLQPQQATSAAPLDCEEDPSLPQHLMAAPAREFIGKAMYTDYSRKLCGDCITECWVANAGKCIGLTFERYEHSEEGLGACTFFSAIEGAAEAMGKFTVVTTSDHSSSAALAQRAQ